VESQPLTEALSATLADRGVPPHRIQLACRATAALLDEAVVERGDGTVFVVTGDIPAMWLRDSAAQVRPLLALAAEVPSVLDLVEGVLRSQVAQVLVDPRANAFNAEPNGRAQRRDWVDQSPWVFERKYAVDSLCAPLGLAWSLWRASGSTAHVDERFLEAASVIVALWLQEQDHEPGSYVFRRLLARRRDSLPRRGRGSPVVHTGMTWSGFRPSDDACRYGYNVPANAFAAVTLERLTALLEAAGVGAQLAADAARLAAEIRVGIARAGVVEAESGEIYAYEVDGLGNALLLDDANVPSLLSLPYLGFCAQDEPVYRATRTWALGPSNPTWASGRAARGVGSTHTPRGWVWPLAIAMEGLTAADAEERETALGRLEAMVGDGGRFHESVDCDDARRWTRRWFSWADMLYVELVLATAGIVGGR
jgi:meiotically up-regulated gene 157 (Mug157) protein